MSDSDVTLGELARRMDSMHSDVRELRSAVVSHDDLKSAVGSWQLLLQAQEARQAVVITQIENRLVALESWNTWAMRIVLGAVLVAIIGLVVGPTVVT